MAIDSRQKRESSFIDSSGSMPVPDGTIGLADRIQLLWWYSGLAAAAPATLIIATRGASGEGVTRRASVDGVVRSGGRA